jgi:hypothetical protein
VPVGEGADEVVQIAPAVPVPRDVVRRLDLGHPVQQLAALAVHVVDDRVDDELAAVEPAGAHHARPGQERPADGHTAPHVDARIPGFALARVELPADGRMHAVAGDDDVRADTGQCRVVGGGTERQVRRVLVLRDARASVVEQDGVRPEAFPYGAEQHGVQPAAVDGVLRSAVAGVTAGGLAEDELAEPVEEHRLGGRDGRRGEFVLQAQLAQHR